MSGNSKGGVKWYEMEICNGVEFAGCDLSKYYLWYVVGNPSIQA